MSDIVPLNKYSFRLIDLPHGYNTSLSELVDRSKSIIKANEKHYGRKCRFYIGKTTILEESGEDFDLDDRDTWDKKYIRDHWNRRKDDGHDAMVVLTAVPHSRHSAQEYICKLKKGLVTHFWDDKRLENKNKKTGRRAKKGGAYVLYLAMTFEKGKQK